MSAHDVPPSSSPATRPRSHAVRVWPSPVVAALVLAALLTVAVSSGDALRFAYENSELRVALETTTALVGVMLGVLALGRSRQTGSLGDLMLAGAIFALSSSGIVLNLLPRGVDDSTTDAFAVWAPLIVRTLGAAMLAGAAWTMSRPVGRFSRRTLAFVGGGVVLGVVLVTWIFSDQLPSGVRITLPITEAARPRVTANPTVVVTQGVNSVLFTVAAVGFARRAADRPADRLMTWLAAGSVLAAASRVHFLLFPSLFSDWLYTGDVLRLAGTIAWLVGAIGEIDRYGRDREHLAVLEERRRIARELHDGLVQELSFIRSQTASNRHPDPEVAEHVAASAARALREARLAIDVLSAGDEMPAEVALRQAAEEIARPVGVTVTCSFQPGIDVPSETRHELARVVREAASNAVRHSGATSVAVELDRDEQGSIWLMVADDGHGFDPATTAGAGFGLVSMRERVERLGGTLRITSEIGSGTVIEAVLPATSDAARWRGR